MKRFKRTIAWAVLAGTVATTPVAAQIKSDGFAFLEAVKKRKGDEVTAFLEQPGSTLVNTRDIASGETALHIVTQRRDPVWVRFLLSKGANPDTEDKHGVAPIEIAVQLGFIEGVEALLDRGAEVDVTDSAGETPLIAAVHRRDGPLVRLLMSKGASADRADNSGRTARDYARLMGAHSGMLQEIERAESERGETQQSYGPK